MIEMNLIEMNRTLASDTFGPQQRDNSVIHNFSQHQVMCYHQHHGCGYRIAMQREGIGGSPPHIRVDFPHQSRTTFTCRVLWWPCKYVSISKPLGVQLCHLAVFSWTQQGQESQQAGVSSSTFFSTFLLPSILHSFSPGFPPSFLFPFLPILTTLVTQVMSFQGIF